MYCPKCGKSNSDNLKFCRSCGIEIEKVAEILKKELIKLENQSGFFSERLFERLGFGFLYAFCAVGFGLVFSLAVYYKFMIFGAEMMGYFAVFGFLFLGLLSVSFFGIRRYMANKSSFESAPNTAELDSETLRELNPGTPATAASVTEQTTTRLHSKIKR